MHGLGSRDGDKVIDWGKTSEDYAVHRPGPPLSFFARLAALGIGLEGQCILDLGTGTGVMARQFARQGAVVQGVDISAEQIAMASQLAKQDGSQVEFSVHPAESLPWTEPTFDVVTANQCWLYFDKVKAISELRRVLKPGGLLVTSHFSWLPRLDDIARRSEQLVLQFNPQWSAADWSGVIPPSPQWAEQAFDVTAMFYYDEPIPFTRESWCGRIRACRGIGATLSPSEVAAFDAAHQDLLRRTVPDSFTVLHRLDAHVFAFKANAGWQASSTKDAGIDMRIREATEADLPAIVDIYNQSIPAGWSTADTTPITVADRMEWFRKFDPARRPIWVAEIDGQVVATSYLSSFYGGRPAYDATAEMSTYVATAWHRRGIGRRFKQWVIEQCPRLGVTMLLSMHFDHNEATRRINESLGFQQLGHLTEIADVRGKKRGLVIWALRIPTEKA